MPRATTTLRYKPTLLNRAMLWTMIAYVILANVWLVGLFVIVNGNDELTVNSPEAVNWMFGGDLSLGLMIFLWVAGGLVVNWLVSVTRHKYAASPGS